MCIPEVFVLKATRCKPTWRVPAAKCAHKESDPQAHSKRRYVEREKEQEQKRQNCRR